MQGRVVARFVMDANRQSAKQSLQLDHLNKGIFFLQLTGETIFETKKLIIN